LRIFSWLVVSVSGLLEALGHRFQTDFDGVNYLDVAGNYLRGDWHNAVNAYWSPLYSWILTIPLSLLRSSLYWESTLVHLVDFAILLASFAAFEFLLSELLRSPFVARSETSGTTGLSESAWRLLGLALFLYASLFMALYNGNTPDLSVTIAVYAAAGLLLRVHSGRAGWASYICLGAVLGLGYLAKTAMFPLAFVFLSVALFSSPARMKAGAKILAAVFVFALFAGPWIAILSHSKGRFTFGDSGKLNYIGSPSTPSLSNSSTSAAPEANYVHPLPELDAHPPVLVFPAPVSGTFPPWYDPSYWNEGVRFHFSLDSQVQRLHQSYDAYWDILIAQGAFVLALLALFFSQGEGDLRLTAARLARVWPLWLPGFAALAMYALVHVEPRYVAGSVTLVWLALFASLRFPLETHPPRWVISIVLALFLATFLPLTRSLVSDVHVILRPPPDANWEVAQELHDLGIPPGGTIALIGMPKETYYFAHLAQVRIVANVPPAGVDEYWSAPPEIRAHVRSLFIGAGAEAILAPEVPPGENAPGPGWVRMEYSPYWVMLLSNAVTTSAPAHSTGNSESPHE
jgi:hypothetical protein